MRTTITLEPDVAALVQKQMRERGISFKEAVNSAIRAGLGGGRKPFRTKTYPLGLAKIPGHKALRLAAQLEDEELIRRYRERR